MESKITRIFKIAFAVIAVLIFGAVGGLIVTVSAQDTEAPTVGLKLETYTTYNVYPDGYQASGYDFVPFAGTYYLTGRATEDISFKSNGKPVTYNVVFHNLEAVASTWYGMISVDPGVTLNVTVYGDNRVYGYNHPGFNTDPLKNGEPPVVNITMTEGSRLRVGCNYYDTTNCFNAGITVTLTNGSSSIDMSQEGWQNNREIAFTNGSEYGHEMKYVYVDDETCRYQCNDCSAFIGIDSNHAADYVCYEKDHPDRATKHANVCYLCEHEFESSDHVIGHNSEEDYHVEFCYYCGYEGEKTPHTLDGTGCTVCGLRFTFLHEADGEKAYVFLPSTLSALLQEKGGKVTLLQDAERTRDLYVPLTIDTTVDLAGYTLDGMAFSIGEGVTLTFVDTSEDKSGVWKFSYAIANNVDGTLNLNGISANTPSILVNDGGVLNVKDVTILNKFFLRISQAKVEINGLTSDGTLDLDLDAYWGNFQFNISNIKLGKFVFDTTYGQEISLNMLLPEGYAYTGADGLIDGNCVEIYNVTGIVEHGEHNNDKRQTSASEHWFSCTCGYSDNPVKEPHTLGADGLCSSCSKKIVATLVANGITMYYSDLPDALLGSNNYKESTVTLLCDFAPADYEELKLKEKVVLDLNGYKYSVNGRLLVYKDLTIVDSSEGKTGKMYGSGDTSYIIEFHNGSTVTLNDGEYYGLIYSELYGGDERATITINGGRFIGKELFRLGTGTTIVVNGGVFECSKSVFNHTWSTKVTYVINGGVFINSTVFYSNEESRPATESFLGKSGDCELCFISSTGKVLTTEDLCNFYGGEIFIFHKGFQQVATDESHGLYCEACQVYTKWIDHTEAYTPNDDGTSHVVFCAYCEWNIDTREHAGGEATCTEKAVCEDCSAPYGSEPQGHKYDNDCDSECNVCNDTREVPDHVYDNGCDVDCNVCSGVREVDDHVYDNACDTVCNECEDVREITHTYKDGTCTVCGSPDPNAQGSASGGGASSSTPSKGEAPPDSNENSGDQNNTDPEDSGMGAGIITVIVVGAVIVIGGGITAFWFIRKKKFTNV